MLTGHFVIYAQVVSPCTPYPDWPLASPSSPALRRAEALKMFGAAGPLAYLSISPPCRPHPPTPAHAQDPLGSRPRRSRRLCAAAPDPAWPRISWVWGTGIWTTSCWPGVDWLCEYILGVGDRHLDNLMLARCGFVVWICCVNTSWVWGIGTWTTSCWPGVDWLYVWISFFVNVDWYELPLTLDPVLMLLLTTWALTTCPQNDRRLFHSCAAPLLLADPGPLIC